MQRKSYGAPWADAALASTVRCQVRVTHFRQRLRFLIFVRDVLAGLTVPPTAISKASFIKHLHVDKNFALVGQANELGAEDIR